MFLVRPSRRVPVTDINSEPNKITIQNESVDAFERHGFYINNENQIFDNKSGKSWKQLSEKFAGSAFKITKDMKRNSTIYEALADSLQVKVENELLELGLKEFRFPILDEYLDEDDKFKLEYKEGKLDKLYWRVLATPNAFNKAKRLIVMIPNYNVRPWHWSTRLSFNISYKEGSFLTYTKKFIDLGYEVVLSNVNENDCLNSIPTFKNSNVSPEVIPIPGHKSIDHHVKTLFNNVIFPSDPEKLFVITHRYGGHALIDAIKFNFISYFNKIQAIAFLDSIHSSESLPTEAMRKWLIEVAIHWVKSKNVTVGESVPDLRFGCTVLSAGGSDNDEIFIELKQPITEFFNSR